MHRVPAIVLAFQRDTGHIHPHRNAVIHNYAPLMTAMRQDKVSIKSAIDDLLRAAGLER